MNSYEKWGRSFVDSLMRHIGTAIAIWIGTEVKYQELNFQDLGWFILWGAIIPTVAEFFKQGLPPMESTTITSTTTVEHTGEAPSGEKVTESQSAISKTETTAEKVESRP